MSVFLSLIGACCLWGTPPHDEPEAISAIDPQSSVRVGSKTISIDNWESLKTFINNNADGDTLVIWDVDLTLLVPNDPIFHPMWNDLLDKLMGGKKFFKDKSGNTRFIFREILMSAPHSLLDEGSTSFIKELQDRGIRNMAFTAAPGGEIGRVKSFVDWRQAELEKGFSFDFGRSFPGIPSFNLPKDDDKAFPPTYKSGILVTSLHDKGPVLSNFFAAIGDEIPKKILFIDDQMRNVESVANSFEDKTQVIGIHYTAANNRPSNLDPAAAKFQVDNFLETGIWISYDEACNSSSSE